MQTILNSQLWKYLLLDASALALLPRSSFANVTCDCPIRHPNLHDLLLRAGSSTCSFDLNPPPPSTLNVLSQTDFPLASDPFCIPTPRILRTRCSMLMGAPKKEPQRAVTGHLNAHPSPECLCWRCWLTPTLLTVFHKLLHFFIRCWQWHLTIFNKKFPDCISFEELTAWIRFKTDERSVKVSVSLTAMTAAFSYCTFSSL